jgi:anti-sigma-K factor RskA
MAYSEDHIALAAEYAIGTLDAGERAQVEAMMSADRDFMAMVEAWQQKLGALNQMVGLVEPPPSVWENIKAAIGHASAQAPLMLPEQPQATPVAPEIARQPVTVANDSNIVELSSRARRWRNVATAMTAIAAALVAVFTIGLYQPDLLPAGLRPKLQTQVAQSRPPVTQPTSSASAQYVAVLAGQGGAPAFILTVDSASKNFTIRKVDAAAQPGKSYELWLISDKLATPRSLGVVGDGDFTARPVLASYDADTINTATYAVTVEQAGGSPDGAPHSTPVFTGKLIETVPPAR